MSSNFLDIPAAVAAYLNAATSFSKKFTVTLKNMPTVELDDMKDLKVYCLSATKTIQIVSRAKRHSVVSVPIVIEKKVDKDNKPEVDALIALADEISNYLIGVKLAGNFVATTSTFNATFSEQRLHEQNAFTGVLTIGYWDGN